MRQTYLSNPSYPIQYEEISENLYHLVNHLVNEFENAGGYLTPTELEQLIDELTEIHHGLDLLYRPIIGDE